MDQTQNKVQNKKVVMTTKQFLEANIADIDKAIEQHKQVINRLVMAKKQYKSILNKLYDKHNSKSISETVR